MIDELRYVANAVKHGEGPATGKLKSLRPELFTDPAYANIEGFDGMRIFEIRKFAAPLAGEDLFVSEDLLMRYAEASVSFFLEIAAHFEKHENEHY
jgi:hypothetical protein